MDYTEQVSQLVASIRLGYEAESEDPQFLYRAPDDEQVQWLANWLVSEGWTRDQNWARASNT